MIPIFRKKSAAIVLAALTASASASDEDEIKQNIESNIPGMKVVYVAKTPFEDMYQVVANGYTVFYADKTGKMAVFGNLVDLRSKQNLTELEVEKYAGSISHLCHSMRRSNALGERGSAGLRFSQIRIVRSASSWRRN